MLLNRSLRREFGERLAEAGWDIALLQEVPVGWLGGLAEQAGAVGRFALTSRNWMSPVTAPIWNRRPHLVGSWEGGSNLILVRKCQTIVPGRSGAFTLRLRPERRRLNFVEIEGGPVIFNLHASTGMPRAPEDILRAASLADRRAAGQPIVFGGDLNVRPELAPWLFDRLADDHGLELPEGASPDSIDQILSAGALFANSKRPASGWREFRDPDSGLMARLSDHDPVLATVEF